MSEFDSSPGPDQHESDDPFVRFDKVFSRASQSPPFDPTAMTLSTVGYDGSPSSRIVLLKKHDASGFYFFTNYGSRKARELEANPRAALCFYWPWIDEQIRVEGTVTRVGKEESDSYFKSRHRVSQLGAWASHQSQPLESRTRLTENLKAAEARFEDQLVPRPPYWGGFHLSPVRIEFWRNGEFRLHDREVYSRPDREAQWKIERLYP